MYVTACNLEKAVIFDQQLGLKATDAFRLMYTHTVINMCYMRMAIFITIDLLTKCEMSSIIRYKDMTGAPKCRIGSHDSDYAISGMNLSSAGYDLA